MRILVGLFLSRPGRGLYPWPHCPLHTAVPWRGLLVFFVMWVEVQINYRMREGYLLPGQATARAEKRALSVVAEPE